MEAWGRASKEDRPPPARRLSLWPPHLGRTAQVVIVHLLDGLEVDDPFQLCLVLVCKGHKGQAKEACPTSCQDPLTWRFPIWERG